METWNETGILKLINGIGKLHQQFWFVMVFMHFDSIKKYIYVLTDALTLPFLELPFLAFVVS